jgi:DNA modification methylase
VVSAGKGGGEFGNRKYIQEIENVGIDNGFDSGILNSTRNWLCFCSKQQIVELIQKAEGMSLKWMILSWHKPNPTPFTCNKYLSDTEYIIHAFNRLPDTEFHNKYTFIVHPVEKNDFDHPTSKPLKVMKKVLLGSTKQDDIILDPFMGTASTGISCLDLKRKKFIGIEINEKYFNIACRRIENYLNSKIKNNFFE